jgi:putative transposase
MSFRLIEAEKAQHSVSLLCSVLGVTRAGFYAWRRRPPCARELQDRQLLELIGRIHRQSKETYGVPRIHAELITYVPSREGFLFLAAVIDAFSRRCVGWSMRNDLRSELVLDALGMAITQRKPRAGLVHHSDRGSQYTSLAFGKTLGEAGVLQSIGRRGDAFDNAVAESFFATLETELFDRTSFLTRDQARIGVFDFIEGFYNPRRRHSALGYPSPATYEQRATEKEDNLEKAANA